MSKLKKDQPLVASALNKVLEGERMIIRVYNSSLNQIDDGKVKKLLTAFQEDHKLIIERVKARMRSLGIKPKNSLGLLESIDRAMMEVTTLIGIGPNDDDIIEKIYNKEAKGLQKIKKIETESLESASKKLVKRIITINTNNLNQLKDLIM